MAKKGYFGGSPEKVRRALVTDVLDILDFEEFNGEYEEAFYSLNEK